MKNILTTILLLALVFTTKTSAQLFPTLGGQRAGISSLQFLKIGVGGRATAMGDAFIAIADDASALYWNPAGLAFAKQNEVMFSHNSWFADISQEFIGGFYRLSESDVVGVSLTSLHMDNMPVTDEFNPFGNGQFFGFGDIAFAVSYSRKMTEQFSVGASIRYVEETLDVLKMRGVLLDIGTMYWTGLGTTRFAVACLIVLFATNLDCNCPTFAAAAFTIVVGNLLTAVNLACPILVLSNCCCAITSACSVFSGNVASNCA